MWFCGSSEWKYLGDICTMKGGDCVLLSWSLLRSKVLLASVQIINFHMFFFSISTIILANWVLCRGPGLDRWARIQFGWVHFWVLSDLNDKNMLRHRQGTPTDLLWSKNVTWPTGGPNWPLRSTVKKVLRCLREISPSQSFGSFPPVPNSFRWFRSKLSKICVYFL